MSEKAEPESALGEYGPGEGTGAHGAGPGPADGVRTPGAPPQESPPQEPPRRAPGEGRRRSWTRVGFSLGLGATVAWLAVQTVLRVSSMLTLLLLSAFIAIGLEPVVGWFTRRGLRRGWAVAIVLTGFVLLLGGFLALVIPPVAKEITALIDAVPGWLQQLHDHQSAIGRLEDRYHVVEKAKQQIGSGGAATGVAGGVLGAGQLVLSTLTSTAIVITVTLYCMAALPVIKQFCYRFVAASRRERVEGVAEEIMSRIGKFMLGNLITSAIAGAATFGWCVATGVPYAAALGIFTALMDLIPIVGSTLAGIVVSLVALSVSLPIAIATALFYIFFRVAEDYLIVPRAMKFAVDVHPLVTILAVLVGGALLGIIGALVAIPAAVAVGLLLDEYVFPKKQGS
ncbi:AI-2E family transporter [Streptomyces sp. NPDC005423]|uniref:AI-2E family transporter n=1 Tax=Streptomyces sp. NPDC005423 TaxID=3155343 RepID=UPI0033A80C37